MFAVRGSPGDWSGVGFCRGLVGVEWSGVGSSAAEVNGTARHGILSFDRKHEVLDSQRSFRIIIIVIINSTIVSRALIE